MNINYKQPQFELFPSNSATLEDIDRPRILLAKLTLSVENLVIFFILGIMVAIFAFSLGVERGKNIAAQALDERVAAAWNVGSRTMATVPSQGALAMSHRPPKLMGNHGLLAAASASLLRTRLTLQVATYSNEEYARGDALMLKAKGLTPSFLIKSGRYWLLCVGNFTNKENAEVFLRKLPNQYRGSQLRRY